MALWVARAGRHGENESYALDHDAVVIGWEEVPDLSSFASRDQLWKAMQEIFPDDKPKTVKNWEGQLWMFSNKFKVGDIVALPLKTQSAIAFGRIKGPYQYRPDAPPSAKHQCPVVWLSRDIPRRKIDSDLLYSLGGAMTVFQVRRNNAEKRIRATLDGATSGSTAGPASPDTTNADAQDVSIDLATQATDQIIGFIDRKFRGHSLSHLVAGVLRAQGYSVRVSSEGADGGVDIVAGQGPMGFHPPRLCVQVKSGDDPVDVTVLRELQGVMKNYRAEQGLIVAWGGYKQSVVKEARQLYFEIRLWDQTDLVRAVQEVYDRLEGQLQAELPLKRTWVLVVEEG